MKLQNDKMIIGLVVQNIYVYEVVEYKNTVKFDLSYDFKLFSKNFQNI